MVKPDCPIFIFPFNSQVGRIKGLMGLCHSFKSSVKSLTLGTESSATLLELEDCQQGLAESRVGLILFGTICSVLATEARLGKCERAKSTSFFFPQWRLGVHIVRFLHCGNKFSPCG